MDKRGSFFRYVVAVAAGVVYGAGLRLLFALSGHSAIFQRLIRFLGAAGGVMTLGFLVFAPIVVGWIVIALLPQDDRLRWARWIFLPWLSILFAGLLLLAFNLEGWICLVFAAPIMMLLSSAGGAIAGYSRWKRRVRPNGTTALCLALIPVLITSVEGHINPPRDIRTVSNAVVIHAPPQVIWHNIERVRPILHNELRPSWSHAIGFPLPVEATLDHEGVGGIRHASFEGGLLFIETIYDWSPGKRIAFSIKADTADIPPTTLDEHVTIGGRYFDVLDGAYDLQPLPDGSTRLLLTSHERLNTDFNTYAALWTDAVMRDLQGSILEVIRMRCEQESTSPSSATLKP